MNSKKPFDPNKPCTTLEGWSARLLCTDFDGSYDRNLLFAIRRPTGKEFTCAYRADGKIAKSKVSTLDLINLPEKTREFWNLYARNCAGCPDKPRGFETASLPSARHETLEAALKVWVDSSAFAVLEVVRVDGEIVDTILHKREKR